MVSLTLAGRDAKARASPLGGGKLEPPRRLFEVLRFADGAAIAPQSMILG